MFLEKNFPMFLDLIELKFTVKVLRKLYVCRYTHQIWNLKKSVAKLKLHQFYFEHVCSDPGARRLKEALYYSKIGGPKNFIDAPIIFSISDLLLSFKVYVVETEIELLLYFALKNQFDILS